MLRLIRPVRLSDDHPTVLVDRDGDEIATIASTAYTFDQNCDLADEIVAQLNRDIPATETGDEPVTATGGRGNSPPPPVATASPADDSDGVKITRLVCDTLWWLGWFASFAYVIGS